MLEKVKKRPGRTKKTRKRDRVPTAMERWHMDRLAAQGCAVPGCRQIATIHHEHRGGEPRDHKKTVPLCPKHHFAWFPEGRHALGRYGFNQRHGMDIEALAAFEWTETERLYNG